MAKPAKECEFYLKFDAETNETGVYQFRLPNQLIIADQEYAVSLQQFIMPSDFEFTKDCILTIKRQEDESGGIQIRPNGQHSTIDSLVAKITESLSDQKY